MTKNEQLLAGYKEDTAVNCKFKKFSFGNNSAFNLFAEVKYFPKNNCI